MSHPDDDSSDSTGREHLWKIVREVRFAMFTTRDAEGFLRSRPLTLQNGSHDTGRNLYFFVAADSEVVSDVAADERVAVVYADPGSDRYVSISGHAKATRDPQRQAALWTPMAQAWFPGGAEDPSLRMLDVHMHQAEYWDVKSSKMVQLFKMAKAAVTGKPPSDMGEHKDVKV